MSVDATTKSWCESGHHSRYERYALFNRWLDEKGEDAEALLSRLGVMNLGAPSKALFAGDYPAYIQELERYTEQRRSEALGASYFDSHWSTRNQRHFQRLVEVVSAGAATPFLGAGVSCSSGCPTWTSHLLTQARTAGVKDAAARIARGEYEEVVDEIVKKLKALFMTNVRDDFLIPPKNLHLPLAILRIFRHVVVTTNYDKFLELALKELGQDFASIVAIETDNQPLIAAITNRRRALLKVHGDIDAAASCILTSSQYNAAYGDAGIDFGLPIPRKLRRLYEQTRVRTH